MFITIMLFDNSIRCTRSGHVLLAWGGVAIRAVVGRSCIVLYFVGTNWYIFVWPMNQPHSTRSETTVNEFSANVRLIVILFQLNHVHLYLPDYYPTQNVLHFCIADTYYRRRVIYLIRKYTNNTKIILTSFISSTKYAAIKVEAYT